MPTGTRATGWRRRCSSPSTARPRSRACSASIPARRAVSFPEPRPRRGPPKRRAPPRMRRRCPPGGSARGAFARGAPGGSGRRAWRGAAEGRCAPRGDLLHLALDQYKTLVRDQFFVLLLERERAVEALATMVREPDQRAELLKRIAAIIAAGDSPTAAERER